MYLYDFNQIVVCSFLKKLFPEGKATAMAVDEVWAEVETVVILTVSSVGAEQNL